MHLNHKYKKRKYMYVMFGTYLMQYINRGDPKILYKTLIIAIVLISFLKYIFNYAVPSVFIFNAAVEKVENVLKSKNLNSIKNHPDFSEVVFTFRIPEEISESGSYSIFENNPNNHKNQRKTHPYYVFNKNNPEDPSFSKNTHNPSLASKTYPSKIKDMEHDGMEGSYSRTEDKSNPKIHWGNPQVQKLRKMKVLIYNLSKFVRIPKKRSYCHLMILPLTNSKKIIVNNHRTIFVLRYLKNLQNKKVESKGDQNIKYKQQKSKINIIPHRNSILDKSKTRGDIYNKLNSNPLVRAAGRVGVQKENTSIQRRLQNNGSTNRNSNFNQPIRATGGVEISENVSDDHTYNKIGFWKRLFGYLYCKIGNLLIKTYLISFDLKKAIVNDRQKIFIIRLNDEEYVAKKMIQETPIKSQESEILEKMECDQIVKYYGHVELKKTAYIFTEYLSQEVPKINTTEQLKKILTQIGKGVKYLHDRDICHLDIKPNNIRGKNGKFKLIDFGYSHYMGDYDNKTLIAKDIAFGTIPFKSREILQESAHSKKSDIFALGMTAWTLARGFTPFIRDGKIDLIEYSKFLVSGKNEFEGVQCQKLRDLIRRCTDPDPEKRLTIENFLEHQFFWLLNE